MKNYDILVLSGGFDPLHVGHIRMFQHARDMAALLVVGVNSDDWLQRNRGRVYMPFEERREMVASIRGVTSAVGFDDADDTAVSLLRMVHTMSPGAKLAFGNGGERTAVNVPEVDVCKELGVDLVWGLGGDHVQASSDRVHRPL
ncbi:MAG: adenylyltransferase/cytidyltransferase family protein [Planctomycetota bacterium]